MPRRKDVEPVEKPGLHARHDSSSKTFTHPAFGAIAVSRHSGASTLFGSDFEHGQFMSIRISRAELNRELGRDWHHAREQIVEVYLSEAQWATFVSSPNMGSGVPCTLAYIGGEQMPSIPLRKEEDVVKNEMSKKLNEQLERIDKTIAAITSETSGLSKKKQDVLLEELRSLRRTIEGTIPFMADQFAEFMETKVEKGKVEIDAYMTGAVMRAGIKALTGDALPLLTSGEEKND